jgi:hypothetical protein
MSRKPKQNVQKANEDNEKGRHRLHRLHRLPKKSVSLSILNILSMYYCIFWRELSCGQIDKQLVVHQIVLVIHCGSTI